MPKKAHISRYTADEIASKRARGKSRTVWRKAAAMSGVALERSVAADRDEAGMVIDWDSAAIELPQPKVVLNMRIDRHVLNYFRRTGPGYQTRINAVLSAYVRAHEQRSS